MIDLASEREMMENRLGFLMDVRLDYRHFAFMPFLFTRLVNPLSIVYFGVRASRQAIGQFGLDLLRWNEVFLIDLKRFQRAHFRAREYVSACAKKSFELPRRDELFLLRGENVDH